MKYEKHQKSLNAPQAAQRVWESRALFALLAGPPPVRGAPEPRLRAGAQAPGGQGPHASTQ